MRFLSAAATCMMYADAVAKLGGIASPNVGWRYNNTGNSIKMEVYYPPGDRMNPDAYSLLIEEFAKSGLGSLAVEYGSVHTHIIITLFNTGE